MTYDGHPLDLSCPQCRSSGTAWFSPDEASCLRIDEVPVGFRLVDQPEGIALGPIFACVHCDGPAVNL